MDSPSGKIVYSTDESQVGKDKSQGSYFTVPMQSGKIHIKDIYHSQTIHKSSMVFSVPLYSAHGKRITGVLAACIDLTRSLYPLLLDRTGMGKTGETLIVNKDGVALNELKWHANAPLTLKIRAKPALLASRGDTGITETLDY